MGKIIKKTYKKTTGNPQKSPVSATDDTLRYLAFDNVFQAHIISTISRGTIIMANKAACKLLGYSNKELVNKNWSIFFNINDSNFKKMLRKQKSEGHATALVTVVKKGGKILSCEITSAIFIDEDSVQRSIITIEDRSQIILEQKNIDDKKEKAVADNILLAKSKQKKIDAKKEKRVADNIFLAELKQKKIDAQKEEIVSANAIQVKAEMEEWKKYIGKASYDVMWDWDITTGAIYVGDSITELLGCKVENNILHFKDFIRSLVPKEKIAVKKKLFDALATGKNSWKDTFMLKRYDASVASTSSRGSIIRDGGNKALYVIGATKDISKMPLPEKKLKEQILIQDETDKRIKLTSKLSFDVIWDWNLVTNEVFIGDGFEELFGYHIKNNKGDIIADWAQYLHPDDKRIIQKELNAVLKSIDNHWEHAYRVTRTDGSIAKVYIRANIIRQKDGKAYRMIGALQDFSRQKDLEERLKDEIISKEKLKNEYNENFKLIFNSSSDVLYDIDLTENKMVLSDAYEQQFGYKINGNMSPVKDWTSHIHEDDREAVVEDYLKMLSTADTDWESNYRFKKSDHSIANVVNRAVILRNVEGKAYRMIGSMQDMSKQKVLEAKLEHEIKLKEQQISEATEDAKEAERSDIGKELHDNVNQLLATSKMFLELAKQGGDNSKLYLNRSSEYTMNAIEEIRKLTKGLTTDFIKNLGLCEAIDKIINDAREGYAIKIVCDTQHFSEKNLNDKFKLNIFRVIQEQLNNILKHAKASKIIIRLSRDTRSIDLSISDDGLGFDIMQKQKGIGIANIKSRATAYNGTAEFISQKNQGCILKIKIPLKGGFLVKTGV